MGKKSKKILSLILAGALFLTGLAGCAKGKNSTSSQEKGQNAQEAKTDSKAMGRYLEQENILPEGTTYVSDMVKIAEDQSLHMVGGIEGQGYHLYRSYVDGEAWVSQDMPKFMTQHWADISNAVLSPQGELFIQTLGQGDGSDSTTGDYWLISADGMEKQLSIRLPGTEAPAGQILDNAEFSDDGALYVYSLIAQEAYEIDKESGAIAKTFPGDGSPLFFGAAAGSQLILITKNGVVRYDRSSGEELPEDAVLTEHLKQVVTGEDAFLDGNRPVVFAPGDDGSLFFADATGIYHHEEGGSVCEQLLNGALSSLSDPKARLRRLIRISDKKFLVSVLMDTQARMFSYAYNPDVPSVPDTELAVYALEDSDYLQQVVSDFKKEHQELYVKLQIGISGEDGVMAEDALRTLNTDILAGKGPDVLILDGMPIDSYIEKNILEDLTPLVEEIEKQDGLFENVAKVYARDGKLCAVPASVMIPITAGEQAAVAASSSLEDLADWAEGQKAQDPAQAVCNAQVNPKLFLRDLFLADSSGWTKENREISQEKLETFLKAAKRLRDTGVYQEDGESYFDDKDFTRQGFDNITLGLFDICFTNSEIALGNIGSMQTFSEMTSFLEETPADIGYTYDHYVNDYLKGMQYDLTGSGEHKTFIPANIVGINKTTGAKDAAELFVKALLGSSISANRDCLSVNQKAFEASCQDPTPPKHSCLGVGNISVSSSSEGAIMVTFVQIWPAQEDLTRLKSLMESLDSPSLNDTVIMDLVLEQGVKYLKGEQELDKTVEAIMQKIKLYQAE